MAKIGSGQPDVDRRWISDISHSASLKAFYSPGHQIVPDLTLTGKFSSLLSSSQNQDAADRYFVLWLSEDVLPWYQCVFPALSLVEYSAAELGTPHHFLTLLTRHEKRPGSCSTVLVMHVDKRADVTARHASLVCKIPLLECINLVTISATLYHWH